MVGLVLRRLQPGAAKGLIFLVLKDQFGLAVVLVKPAVCLRYPAFARAEPFAVVTGRLQRLDRTTNVMAESSRPRRAPRKLVAREAHNCGWHIGQAPRKSWGQHPCDYLARSHE